MMVMMVMATGIMAENDWIRPVPNGVIVSQPTDLKIVSGSWSVLMVVKPPSADVLRQELDELRAAARHVRSLIPDTRRNRCGRHRENPSLVECVYWREWRILEEQLDMIGTSRGDIFKIVSPDHRDKRGFVDIIGTGLHHLFGLATDSDIRDVRKAIMESRKGRLQVTHLVGQLKTVIDHAVRQQSMDRQRVENMALVVEGVRNMTKALYDDFHIMHQKSFLQERITYFLHIESEIFRQENRLRQLVADLEAGRLTEQLLPRETLRAIIDQYEGTHPNGKGLPLVWYYQHEQIELLLAGSQQYIYRINLPMVSRTDYQKYVLASFPVAQANGNQYKVQVRPIIGYNTENGDMFEPTLCMGKKPTVCRPSTIFADDRFVCERGLVAGYNEDKRACPILFDVGNRSQIYTVQNELILSTLGEELTLSCPGEQIRRKRVTTGLWATVLKGNCQLRGEQWSRTIEEQGNIEVQRNITTYTWDNDANWINQELDENLPDLFLPTLEPIGQRNKEREEADEQAKEDRTILDNMNKDLAKIENKDYGDEIDWYEEGTVGHHVSWLTLGLVGIVFVILGIAIKWIYSRRKKLQFYFGKLKNPKKVDPVVPLLEVTTTQPDPESPV
jgi:hypothetical protein